MGVKEGGEVALEHGEKTESMESAPAAGGTPAYEPPAIAWEEPFEPMAAATKCGMTDPLQPGCQFFPTV